MARRPYYEVRADDNPSGMPLGVHTLSRHDTPDLARGAIAREVKAFALSIYGGGPDSLTCPHLARIVVEVAPDGTERQA